MSRVSHSRHLGEVLCKCVTLGCTVEWRTLVKDQYNCCLVVLPSRCFQALLLFYFLRQDLAKLPSLGLTLWSSCPNFSEWHGPPCLARMFLSVLMNTCWGVLTWPQSGVAEPLVGSSRWCDPGLCYHVLYHEFTSFIKCQTLINYTVIFISTSYIHISYFPRWSHSSDVDVFGFWISREVPQFHIQANSWKKGQVPIPRPLWSMYF